MYDSAAQKMTTDAWSVCTVVAVTRYSVTGYGKQPFGMAFALCMVRADSQHIGVRIMSNAQREMAIAAVTLYSIGYVGIHAYVFVRVIMVFVG